MQLFELSAGYDVPEVGTLKCKEFLSEKIPDDVLKALNRTSRKTTMFKCEFFAILCART